MRDEMDAAGVIRSSDLWINGVPFLRVQIVQGEQNVFGVGRVVQRLL